jgi:hypothetical protein
MRRGRAIAAGMAPEMTTLLAKLVNGVLSGGIGVQDVRAWLQEHWDVRSIGEMSACLARQAVTDMAVHGFFDGSSARPTARQWRTLESAARALGWNGLEAPELAAWVKRIAKVDSPRFLTRAGAAKVISKLETMLEHHHAQPPGE